MNTATYTTEDLANQEYKYGFVTEIETDTVPRGLNEEIVRLISAKKNEPTFMLDWRLKAYRHWVKLEKSQATSTIRRSTTRTSSTTRRQRQTLRG